MIVIGSDHGRIDWPAIGMFWRLVGVRELAELGLSPAPAFAGRLLEAVLRLTNEWDDPLSL
jgi:hypothetical protein